MINNEFPVPAFELTQANSPLLISMPHSGLHLTSTVATSLSDKASVLPDTDWYLPELYNFLGELSVSCVKANYSRYVIDLNRPIDDKPLYSTKTTGLFPDILFDDSPVFQKAKTPDAALQEQYKNFIWQSYHNCIKQELERIKTKFGYAILFDAHSIAAQVPMLFEGTLPDFNWGTNQGNSCHSLLLECAQQSVFPTYSQVANGRFKGGFITREYGRPSENIHAIQLELSQATYLDETALIANQYTLDTHKNQTIVQQLKTIVDNIQKVHLS